MLICWISAPLNMKNFYELLKLFAFIFIDILTRKYLLLNSEIVWNTVDVG